MKKRKVAFTGPEAISQGGYEIIRDVILTMNDVDTFISGCANGVDTLACLLSYGYHPSATQNLIVPRGRHNEELVYFFCCIEADMRALVDVYLMPHGPASTNPHIFRDEHMIALLAENPKENYLAAFPPTSREQQRSGTWTTVRRARSAHVPVWFYPLNGEPSWYEDNKRYSYS